MANMPTDHQAELALISTLGGEGELTPAAGNPYAHQALLALDARAFTDPRLRYIFDAIKAIYNRAEPVSLLMINTELIQLGTIDRVGGFITLTEILMGTDTGRPDLLAATIMERWTQRRLMNLGQKMIESGELLTPAEEIASRLQSSLAEVFSSGTNADVRQASMMLDYIHEGRPFRDTARAEKQAWLGLDSIDEALEAAPGHVIIVSARPGIGKTALAVQGACITSRKGGRPLIISLEMDHDEVFSRIAARLSGASAKLYRRGQWDTNHADYLQNQQDILDRIGIWSHPSNVEWSRVEAVIRDQVRRNKVDSVWIDYFTLIRKPSGKGNDAALWGEISSSIKRVAQELGICIVLLSQLNREGDAVEPKLSDLRESGQLEQDANAVVMLWPKDAKAMESAVETKVIFAKLAKNRSGQAGWRCEIGLNGATGTLLPLVRSA